MGYLRQYTTAIFSNHRIHRSTHQFNARRFSTTRLLFDNEQGHGPGYHELYRQTFQQGCEIESPSKDTEAEKNGSASADSFEEKKSDSLTNSAKAANLTRDSLTHTDQKGKLRMIDVGEKADTKRNATAQGDIRLGRRAFQLVKENKMKKGDVLSVAQIAGIMAAKQTSSLVPLCHPIPLNHVGVWLKLDEERCSVVVTAEVACHGKTGVEMEALTGVTVALLTVYDMCKAVSHDMVIGEVMLLSKQGGQGGNFER